jgi:hypothetical protein
LCKTLPLAIREKLYNFVGKRSMKMEVGDKVLVSPDLTMQKGWMPATVIEVENNSFIGIVVSAQTEDGNVFFGKEYLFKPQTERGRTVLNGYKAAPI